MLMLQGSSKDKPSDSLQLMGGRVEELGNRVLGVDDGVRHGDCVYTGEGRSWATVSWG